MEWPEGAADAEDLIEDEPEKWEYKPSKWYQGRWDLYLVLLAIIVLYYIIKRYRKQ